MNVCVHKKIEGVRKANEEKMRIHASKTIMQLTSSG